MSTTILRIWLGLFLFLPLILSAQDTQRCHHDEKMEQAFLLDPAYKKAIEKEQNNTNTILNSSTESVQVVVTIPVHVVIVHPPGEAIGTGINFSLAHIQSQIDVLNLDFRRLNADASNTPSVFPADDVEIEFCLASVDPNGNPTDGITRHPTNLNLEDDEFTIKSATGWNRNSYMNFWVGDDLGGILGWAYLPTTNNLPNATLDGIVVASCTFGGPGFGSCSPYNLGRTATHEVGHYLGLSHVWGNGGCNNDDNIADTPIQSSSNFGCPNHPSPSCNNGGDMFMNYMDYVNDNCMNAFTTGQGTRMQAILNSSRASLLTAANTVCNNTSAPLAISLINQTNVTCGGTNTGTVTVEGIGGSGSYFYSMNGGTPQSSNVFTELIAGTYSFEVSDGSSSVSLQVTITEPAILVPVIDSQINITCNGSANGNVVVSAIGGTNVSGNGYQFSIDNNPFTGNNFFSNLSAGLHTLNVLDENNCESNLQFFITEPDPLVSFVSSQIPIECAGNDNAMAVIESLGGTAPYQYSLNNGNFTNNNVFTNLTGGIYSLTTLDFNECPNTFSFTIDQPEPLAIAITSQTNAPCFGQDAGEVVITASGGTGALQYVLGNESNNTGIFSNLSAGNFTASVLDENNCTETVTFDITEPTEIIATISAQENVTCFNENNGLVQIIAAGGTGSFQYNLGNENNTTGIFTNLSAGNYLVGILDGNNCSTTLNVDITQSTEFLANISNQQNVNCFGGNTGQIEIVTAGGNGTVQFTLGNETNTTGVFSNLTAGNYIVGVLDENNCTQTINFEITQTPELVATISTQQNVNCFGEHNGQVLLQTSGGNGGNTFTLNGNSNTTGQFNNLSAGNYNILIEDQNNCTTTAEVIITQPTELVLEISTITQASCAGQEGAITVTANGGAGNYTFALGNESNSTGIFENLSGGNYNIQVTDGNSCTEMTNFIIEEPSTINASIAQIQSINCFGENDGAAQITATGGTGTLQYTIGNETNSTGEFNNLPAGNYSVQISDDNNCTQSINLEITQPAELVSNISNQQNINCFEENNGQVQLEASGGSGSITFTLSGDSNTTGLFSNLQAGNYSVMIEDENNCTTTTAFTISQPTELNLEISNITQASCAGQEGAITVTANGGAGNYTFTLGNESNSTGVFENISGGNYNIQVTDENNCTEITNFIIEEPSSINASIVNIQSINCFGENDGAAQITATGGTGTLQYTIGNETNFTGEFNNLPAGNYSVQISDDNNCTQSINLEITQPAELVSNISNQQNINCFEENNGQVQLEASGGNGSITFTLNGNPNTTGQFSNLQAGNYTVMVEDESSCSTTIDFNITQPEELLIIVENINQASCSGQEGTVEVSASGGTGLLEFTLGNTNNSSGTFEGLSGGNYEVQVIDENGCTASVLVDINEPTSLNSSITNFQSVTCNGDNNGSVQLAAIGGFGNIIFSLGNETNSTGLFENLSAGNYSITTTDENNCTSTIDVNVEEPDALTSNTSTTTEVSCYDANDGIANIIATGGTGTLTYTLGNESNSTGNFTDLSAGNYSVMIADENGCTSSVDIAIGSPDELVGEVVSISHISCNGIKDGTVQLDANGGTASYTYSLGGISNTTGYFDEIPGGVYTFTVIDNNGCTSTVEAEVLEPQEITIDLEEVQNPDCNGDQTGMIQINASGGIGTLSYTLGNETNDNGTFSDLNAGNYAITISDENGCTNLSQVEITAPEPIETVILNNNDVFCFGENSGSINLTASGGTGLLEFTLGTETNTSGSFGNLQAGNYIASVVDENNCSTDISFEINEPTELITTLVELTPIDCNGASTGSIQAIATGGIGTLTYQMSTNINTTGIFENLPSGDYAIVVTDENGCATTNTINLEQPSVISLEIQNSSPAGCAGAPTGSINLQVSNGAGNFTYMLNNTTNTTGFFENLPSGIYELVVEDSNGCKLLETITISEENDININNTTITNINCNGDQNGIINISASSSSGDLTFDLNGTINNTGNFDNLPAGNYNVIVSDVNNCSSILSVEIMEPSAIILAIQNTTDVLCFGATTGNVSLSASGGNENFTYTLNGENNAIGIFENLPAGNYSALVTDDLGCTQMQDFEISEPSQLNLATINLTPDYGNGEGSVTLEGSGGTPPFTYSLDNSNFQDENLFSNLTAGDYEGFIQDANGCISNIAFTINLETSISNPTIGINQVDVFPNPFSNHLFINIDLEKAQKIQLDLWTVVGQNISTQTIDLSSGIHQITLDSYSTLPTGSYFLQIKNNLREVGYFKLIKQ